MAELAASCGVLTFLVWWSMTSRYNEIEGLSKWGRPWLSLFAGALVGLVMSTGAFGIVLGLAGMGYTAYLYRDLERKGAGITAKRPECTIPDKVRVETKALRRIGEHGDVRQRSLDAMKRSSAARQRDMTARREKPARPVKVFGSPRIVRGERLDKVQFDYLNAKGEYSSRRVLVQMVGEWEFEGIDLDKEDTRTFRYERVVGDITSLNTGEILDPEEWRDSRR